MKSINYLVLFVFALVVTCYACKKDTSSPLTPKEMVTAHSWKLSSLKINNVEFVKDCDKDDILTFSANGTYLMNVGSITCNAYDSNYSGAWSVTGDGKTMVIDTDSAASVITASKIVLTMINGTETNIMILIPV